MPVDLILYVIAFVFFVLSAVGVPSGRFNFVSAGYAALVLSLIV